MWYTERCMNFFYLFFLSVSQHLPLSLFLFPSLSLSFNLPTFPRLSSSLSVSLPLSPYLYLSLPSLYLPLFAVFVSLSLYRSSHLPIPTACLTGAPQAELQPPTSTTRGWYTNYLAIQATNRVKVL